MNPWQTLASLGLLIVAPAAAAAVGFELLAPGSPVERRITGGEVHRFGIAVPGDVCVAMTVGQSELDLMVTLRAPAGQVLMEVDNPTGRLEPEKLLFVSTDPGIYQIEIRGFSASPHPKKYQVRVDNPQPATTEHRQAATEAAELAAVDRGLFQTTGEGLAKAIGVYERALDLSRRQGDDAREAAVLLRLGLTGLRRGDARAALRSFETSLHLFRELDDLRGAAFALNQMGRAHSRLGAPQPALAAFTESLEIWRELGSPAEEAEVSNNLGLLLHHLGELDQALDLYLRALSIFRDQGDRTLEGVALINIGGIHDSLGKPVDALSHYRQALSLMRSLEDREAEAEALNNLGASNARLGQLHDALENYTASFAILRSLGQRRRQPPVLANMAHLLLDLGEPEGAQELLKNALEIVRELDDRRSEAAILSNLGRASRQLGNWQDAEKNLKAALAVQQEIGDRPGEGMTLLAQAELHTRKLSPEQALGPADRALRLFRDLKDEVGEALAHRILGEAQAAVGDHTSARQALGEALRLSESSGNISEQARALRNMARSRQMQGELELARKDLEKSLDLLESLRLEVSGEHLRISYSAGIRETYESLIGVLLQLHRIDPSAGLTARAFEAAERARARGLLDFLGQARVDLREGDSALLAEESRLRLEMNAKAALRVERLRNPEKAAELEAIDRELASLTTQYQILEARLQAGSPGYARLRQPEVALAEIQREALDRETVLLEYFLAEPQSVLWLVTPDSIASFELPGRTEIETLARRLHEQLGTPSPQGVAGERKDLAELSRILLGPVLDRIAGKRLAIAADGALWYIPFAALPVPAGDGSGNVPLVIEHEVLNVPSAAVLRQLRRLREDRPRPRGAVALLADPVFGEDDDRLQVSQTSSPPPASQVTATVAQAAPAGPSSANDLWTELAGLTRQGAPGAALARLPWSRREAEAIAGEAAERQVLLALDFQASRDLATGPDLSGYRVVHFATHGILDTRHPQLSGLALSQVDERGQPREGFLRLHDIYRMRLSADLVVLSGCETALGKNLRGEGIVGLTHGFFHAGASQVMASLWPVRDRATADLMQRFYRGMFRDGLRPSAALRRAQIEMWRERTWRDPFYWAAFVLQGDWAAEME